MTMEGVAWVMLEGKVNLDAVREGCQGRNRWGWLGHFYVEQVRKKGSHSCNVCHMVITVGIGPRIDKGDAIVRRE